jgi:hypothetical protein
MGVDMFGRLDGVLRRARAKGVGADTDPEKKDL